MKRIIYLFIAAMVLSLVPVTNVMGQVKPRKAKTTKRVKPQKRHDVKENTDLLTEEEMIERMGSETSLGSFDVNGNSDDADAHMLRAREEVETPRTPKEEDKIFDVTEQQPTFSEGNAVAWLSKHVVYPAEAVGSGVEGRVIIKFVIERDGSLSQVRVAKSLDPRFDKEAIRVVKSMPKWNPAMQNGKPVRCNYTVPVPFKKP